MGPPEDWSEPPPPPLPDITSDTVRSALLQLQQLLRVGGGGGGGGPEEATREGLQRAHAMLEACVLPAIAASARQQQQQQASSSSEPAPASAAATQHAAAAALLSRYPIGFSTGDGVADLSASILRMLYIKDLRDLQARLLAPRALLAAPRQVHAQRRGHPASFPTLSAQTQVDSAIVQVQEFTANPRTDASLGKVGR